MTEEERQQAEKRLSGIIIAAKNSWKQFRISEVTDLSITYPIRKSEEEITQKTVLMFESAKMHKEYGRCIVPAVLMQGSKTASKAGYAEYVAFHVGIPVLHVNADEIIDSFLGMGSHDLSLLFQYLECQDCVLEIEDFDMQYFSNSHREKVEILLRFMTELKQKINQTSSTVAVIVEAYQVDCLDLQVYSVFDLVHDLLPLSMTDIEETALLPIKNKSSEESK